ncbi:MAG: metallophosphoesterase [bacterium]
MLSTNFKFLPFVVFGLAILLGGHYFIYRSLIGVFNIDSALFKFGLAAFFFIMPAGFFVSSFLAHASPNLITKVLYIISAAWLGIAVNLLLAACFIRIIFWLANLAELDFNRVFLGAGVFLLAVIFSGYGFWNAFNLQIKNIEAPIKNLPLNWQGKTIVQLSDIHLGRVHGINFLRRIVAQTNAQNPDLILITGDLFDGMDGGLDIFIEQLNYLQAKNGVFFVTGNHESYVGLDKALAVLGQTKIKILSNEVVNLDGLQIVGINYSLLSDSSGLTGRADNEAKIINSLPGFDKNKPSILMYHSPANIEQAIAAGISFQLSGHTHQGQIWLFNLFTRLIYGRYNYGLHSVKDFLIYTTNGIGTWGPPMRTGSPPEIPVFKLRIK